MCINNILVFTCDHHIPDPKKPWVHMPEDHEGHDLTHCGFVMRRKEPRPYKCENCKQADRENRAEGGLDEDAEGEIDEEMDQGVDVRMEEEVGMWGWRGMEGNEHGDGEGGMEGVRIRNEDGDDTNGDGDGDVNGDGDGLRCSSPKGNEKEIRIGNGNEEGKEKGKLGPCFLSKISLYID